MKNSLFLLLLCFALGLYAADETTIPSRITEVNLYRQRALLYQEGSINAKAGDNLFVFTGLSQYIIANSVGVKGEGKGIIQSVKHRINYLNLTTEPKRMGVIRDSIELLSDGLTVIADELFVLEAEEQVVLKNCQLGSEHQGFAVTEVAALADFYRKRLTEIRLLKRNLAHKQTKSAERIAQFQAELENLNAQRSQATQEVVVAFRADVAGPVKLTLNYLVTNVSWEPTYDVRASSSASPILLTLKANVINNTGISWEKVKLSFSTASNDGRTVAPTLSPQYLSYYTPQYQYYERERVQRVMTEAKMSEDADEAAADPAPLDAPTQTAANYTTMTEGTLAQVFEVSIPYDIPADGKETQVDIFNQEIKGEFRHFSVPKLDPEAYLVAYIRQDLLSGKANIYFEGAFVGETFINTHQAQDSMLIALGRDPKVQISRVQTTDFSRRKVIGGNLQQEYAYEITVRNTKKEAVTLTLLDQIPVSQTADIKVDEVEPGAATLDPETGKLTWTLTLKPGETLKLRFGYRVTYPKSRTVVGL